MKALTNDVERFEEVEESRGPVDQRLERFETRMAVFTEQIIGLRAATDCGSERLDKTFHSLSAGLARLERKLDRILALSAESRGRNRP